MAAIVAQLLTAAIVVVVASHANLYPSRSIPTVGDIARAFSAVAGAKVGTALFFSAIVSAAFVAAVICSMTLLETLDELLRVSVSGTLQLPTVCELEADAGTDLRFIQKNLRHASIETTGIYLHAEDDQRHTQTTRSSEHPDEHSGQPKALA